MRHLYLALVLCSHLLFSVPLAQAVDPEVVGVSISQEMAAQTFVGPLPLVIERTPAEKLGCAWTEVVEALDAGQISLASQKVQILSELQDTFGFESAETWSLGLVRRSEEAFAKGDRDTATALLGWAEQLSPASVTVVLSSARIAHLSGYRGLFEQLSRALSAAKQDRVFVFTAAVAALYPTLWALTLALFVTMVLATGYWMKFPLRFVGLRLPLLVRGIVSPLLVLGVLGLPLVLGPLWALTAWSLVILLVMPERRWLVFYAALVLGLWASVVPIRETLHLSLEESRVRAYLRAASGRIERGDTTLINSFLLDYPTSAAVQYTKGVSDRREGRLSEADEAFSRAELIWRSEGSSALPYAVAQRGIVAYLKDDTDLASRRFSEAASLGLTNAAFVLNRSKLAFAMTDTLGSRAYFSEAEGKDSVLAAKVREREERFGDKHPLSIAELPLTFSATLKSILIPFSEVYTRAEAVSRMMMPGVSPLVMGTVSLALLLGFFMRGTGTKRHRREILYPQPPKNIPLRLLVRVVPGGSLLRAGKPGAALSVLSLCILLAMPLVGWPGESLGVLAQLPDFKPYFASLAVLLSLGSVYVSWYLVEKED